MQVKNPLVSTVFNSIDTPVRFTYSQLGPLSRYLNSLMFWKLYTSNFQKIDNKFIRMQRALKKTGILLDNKTVLELGPGNTYLAAYNCLMNGSKKVILVDKYPRYDNSPKQLQLVAAEIEFIKTKYNKKNLRFIKQSRPDPHYISLISLDLTEIETKKLDYIYSFNVLEHVKDIGTNITKMASILKKGAYMYHFIDLRDHYNFSAPFLFYKYTQSQWNKYLTKEGLTYTNRWRYSDFQWAFRKSGFSVIWENVTRQQIPEDQKISSDFKRYSKKDLGITTLEIILKKKLTT